MHILKSAHGGKFFDAILFLLHKTHCRSHPAFQQHFPGSDVEHLPETTLNIIRRISELLCQLPDGKVAPVIVVINIMPHQFHGIAMGWFCRRLCP